MRVVGLDLSLASTGVAVLDQGVVALARVRSTGEQKATWHERGARLAKICQEVVALAAGADLVVVEAPAYSRHLGSAHDRSGLWWMVVERLMSQGENVVAVPPNSRAKYATGKGGAGKDEVVIAVTRRYPEVPVSNNDEADALVLAAMGARHLGFPIEQSLPANHLAAMDGVAWPGPREVEPEPMLAL